MIFSSSSSSASSSSYYGRPSCPCSVRVRVRPCPILPLLIPHKGSSFKLLWEGDGAAGGRARREGVRAREMRDGERDRPRNEAHVTELGRGSRWRRG